MINTAKKIHVQARTKLAVKIKLIILERQEFQPEPQATRSSS